MTIRNAERVGAGFGIVLVWYVAAVLMNLPLILDIHARAGDSASLLSLIAECLNAPRPILPSPDRVVAELLGTTFGYWPLSPRSLVFHAVITTATALVGLALATVAGVFLAVAIVRNRTLEAGSMPLVVLSQTIPILAIAPMAVVVFGKIGLAGFPSKVLITAYLAFFPMTIAMVRGLRSAELLMSELFYTYNAPARTVLLKLDMPASMPFFFSGLKISAGTAVVGAIVSELPTGGSVGLGARLLSGSYYGQTLQIWSALVASAIISLLLVAIVSIAERLCLSWRRA